MLALNAEIVTSMTTENKTYFHLTLITIITLLMTLAVWLPHILRLDVYGLNFSEGFNTIYRNYDGMEYITIAKSLYFPEEIRKIPQPLPAIYYAAHFPGYSLAILVFAPFLGYLKSMLFVALLFTVLSAWMFYFLVRDFALTKYPLWLTILFLILPARWFIIHSVGSSETMFSFFIISALYFLMKYESTSKWRFIYLTGLMGFAAQITRPPGALLAVSVGAYLLWKIFTSNENLVKGFLQAFYKYHPLLLIPLALAAVFGWYQLSYGDFFAYFKTGDNIHLIFPPYQVFNKDSFWVGEIWLEDIIYVFILGFLGVMYLFKQKLYPLAFFVLTYLVATIFVTHRDISRYAAPIFPFVLIAFEKVLTTKEFKIVSVLVGLAIYLYAQNFLLNNTAPYPNVEWFD
jgi:hypothetical protein